MFQSNSNWHRTRYFASLRRNATFVDRDRTSRRAFVVRSGFCLSTNGPFAPTPHRHFASPPEGTCSRERLPPVRLNAWLPEHPVFRSAQPLRGAAGNSVVKSI
jgi:hypothetical protein